MTDEERQAHNDAVHEHLESRIAGFESRLAKLETRMAEKDTQFAVINTKLTAILWGVAAIGTTAIGMALKFLFGM